MVDEYAIINKAKSLGYQAEVYSIKLKQVQIKGGDQKHALFLSDSGYGVRVIKDGKIGLAYSTRLDEKLLDLAIESLKPSKEDEFNVIPSRENVEKLPLKYFDINDAFDKLSEILNSVEEIRDTANITSDYYEAINSIIKVVNTDGIDVEEERSLVNVSLSFVFKRDNFVSPEIYESISSRDFNNLDIKGLLERVKEKAEIFKDYKSVGKKFNEVILTPKAISTLLSPLLSFAVSLENGYRNRSPLMEGEYIKEGLVIIDNPRIPYAPYSRSFDGEGLPSKVVKIIDTSFVKYLSNTYWSLRAGKENTHSSVRSYATLPVISTSLVEIDVNEKAEEDTVVIDEVQGVHTSNFATGQFSVTAPVAWYKGVAVKNLTLTGSLKCMLKGIIGSVGNKKEIYGNVYTYPLKIKGINAA
ncbi:MAG: TldD/PmbA family protein [Sulfolobus sp.]